MQVTYRLNHNEMKAAILEWLQNNKPELVEEAEPTIRFLNSSGSTSEIYVLVEQTIAMDTGPYR